MEQKEPVWDILHKLWSEARSIPTYNKANWMHLERCILAMRNKRDSLQILYELRRFLIEETNNVYRKIGELEEINRGTPYHHMDACGPIQPTTIPNPSHRDVHSSELGSGKASGGTDS